MLSTHVKNTIESFFNARIQSASSIGGGCIADAKRVCLDNGTNIFVKTAQLSNDMFTKEMNGLHELSKANTIRVPKAFYADERCLVLEHIESAGKSNAFFEDFGTKFALLHQFTHNCFGFVEDNYIGSSPQMNIADENEKSNWIAFYFNKRLLYQFKLAEHNGYASEKLRKGFSLLENKIEDILGGSEEAPSLLHGDLWSGNYITDENGDACLIDPATYYGHREADLAMTKLFGGFPKHFYESYNATFPLKDGFEYRENIYKLYHILNHLNIFGSGYENEVLRLLYYYL